MSDSITIVIDRDIYTAKVDNDGVVSVWSVDGPIFASLLFCVEEKTAYFTHWRDGKPDDNTISAQVYNHYSGDNFDLKRIATYLINIK